MKRFKYVLITFAVVLFLAWLTKPSDESCRRHAAAALKKKTTARGSDDLMQKMIELAAEKGILIEDKVFYKTINFRFGKSNKRIGWAAFGMVNIKENKEQEGR